MTSSSRLSERKPFLSYCLPDIGEEELLEVAHTLTSDWITTGPKVQTFQKKIAAYVGAPHAVAVNSATAGLHLVLAAWGIGAGDEVITSPMTFCATAEVIEYQRATPVFVDIDPHTHNIDVDHLEEAITPRTRAIIPVHFAGHPCDMDRIMDIARRHGLFVLEDAAHAIGAQYRGRMVGGIGDATVFSFYATKNLTTAEGGMITCADPELAEKLQILSLHGISRDAWQRYSAHGSWYYEVQYLGYKYNMTDIAAALGLCQLDRLEQFNARRREICARYDKAFAEVEEITPLVTHPDVVSAAHLYVIKLNLEQLSIDRAQFIELLRQSGIGASVHFIPVHFHPYYRDKYRYRAGDYPVAEDVYARSVSLPLYPRMSDADVDMVVDTVKRIIADARKTRMSA